MSTVTLTTNSYRIYVKDKLFKVCKSEAEKDACMARLKLDKTINPDDIKIVFNIQVHK